ncbi:putative proton-coupled thiamine transporter YuaJ [Alkaliphilus metalliredigens QYMF]|uniref:Putative proton-coupled thiamine transporter YuaJ n=1 Tax=Alkaliphilus metalliredigens (strain QYMF) TaxID=293826 RepID=A6TX04_ALKMQ|nr:energy-coupled thiamine transporter ThiT [Alkaliphilus metalliredigens]ABR50722.1 putative proton-coupled thiamine transporter YuaJ [Alkaliphilus metalliredigens QYMF]
MFQKLFELDPNVIRILLALFVFSIGGMLYFKKNQSFKFTTRMLVYGSLCIALSFVLSYIRLYRFPQGGSVTPASMLPLFIYAVAFGPIPGIIAGFALGMLKLIQDPFVIHWAQFFLDYPLAYGALGLAGLYRNNLAVSVLIGGFGRFFMSFLSGVLFFASYAPEGMNPIIYSIVVNGLVLGTDTLICVSFVFIPQIKSAVKHIHGSITLTK